MARAAERQPLPQPAIATRVALPVALALLLLAGAALADGSRTVFSVGARVTPVVRVVALDWPTEVEVTAGDIAAGWVSVPARIEVATNTPDGYRLAIAPRADWAQGLEVQGPMGLARIGSEGGSITRRATAPLRESMALTLRVPLAAGTVPGQYPWPYALQLLPR